MSRRSRRLAASNGVNHSNGGSAAPVQITETYADGGETADLRERLAALELALESVDWRLLTAQSYQEFTRPGLRDITDFCRVMYLKNPLVQRSVHIKRLYVFGQGYSVHASDPDIGQVINSFRDDPDNQIELFGHQAHAMKETELQTDGNLFFVFFTNRVTGRVRLRSMPFEEIFDIISDPQDLRRHWLYERQWVQINTDNTRENKRAYYPDWRYDPVVKPATFNGLPVMWDTPIMHVRSGGYSNWKFSVSEIYAAIDWAKAYKEFLEDWASIVRAYRRFAFQLTAPGGKSAIAAAKAKLNTGVGATSLETNPAPVTGSTFIANEGVNLQPIRTSGATVSADDGRRLLLMVAAATGLPETFFGDAHVGSLATAKSLDRPTELMMRDRQMLWADVLSQMHDYVLLQAVKAPQGGLRGLGSVQVRIEDDLRTEWVEWNEDINSAVSVNWPPIVEHDITASVQAIVQAATLSGQTLAGTIDQQTVRRLLLTALGVQDVDQILSAMEQDQSEPARTTEAALVRAIGQMNDRLASLRE